MKLLLTSIPGPTLRFGLIVTLFFASAVGESISEKNCPIATKIAVENLRYRVLSPSLNIDRTARAFQETRAVHLKCSTQQVSIAPTECKEMSSVLSRIADGTQHFPTKDFEEMSRCRVETKGAAESQAQAVDITRLVDDTLLEQKDSDGEAAYWVADDLLALLLTYPEAILNSVLSHPASRQRFLGDLGGRAFEDLDDDPKSGHEFLRQKQQALSELIRRLRIEYSSQSDYLDLISEMSKACRCIE